MSESKKQYELLIPEKTKIFGTFALSNIEAMRLLRKFGLLRQQDEPVDKKAWGKLEGKERSFRNITEHCMVVGMVTDVILEKLEEKGHLREQERKAGAKGAILHDLTKRQELEKQYGVEEEDEGVFLDPQAKEEFIAELLDKYKLSSDQRKLVALQKLTGEGSIEIKNEKIDISSSRELMQWVILLADAMVAHTKVVSAEDRMNEVINRGEYSKTSDWWYKKLYGEKQFNQIKDKKESAKAVYGKILNFLRQTEDQLKSLLSVEENQSLLEFIENQIKNRYATFK